MKYIGILFVLILFFTSSSFGVEGCLVGTRMYTSKALITILSGPAFTTTSYTDANGRCWSPAPTGSCEVCNGTAAAAAGLLVCIADLFGPRDGAIYHGSYYSSFNIVNCPIDDYSWLFGASAALTGLIFIRRRQS